MIDSVSYPACPAMKSLPPAALEQVAAYFQALAEPTRLQLLNLLREGERNVGELAQLTGHSAANVSRHLALMTQHGLLARESRGNSVFYRIADASIYRLCDLVCDSIARRIDRTAQERAPFVPASARDAPLNARAAPARRRR
jgi:DNA-binding transcriptional ArsR family regulator